MKAILFMISPYNAQTTGEILYLMFFNDTSCYITVHSSMSILFEMCTSFVINVFELIHMKPKQHTSHRSE